MGSSTYLGGSHLDFNKLPLKKGLKLHEYLIWNRNLCQEVGIIHWRGGWRQYVSHCPNADISVSCHKEISKFITKLMKEWRDKQKRKKKKGKWVSSGKAKTKKEALAFGKKTIQGKTTSSKIRRS